MDNSDVTSSNQWSNSNEYRRVTESKMNEWDQKINDMKEKGKDLSEDAKSEFNSKLDELEKGRDSFSNYLSELGDKAEVKWEDFKDEAEDKWNNISRSFNDFFSKYS